MPPNPSPDPTNARALALHAIIRTDRDQAFLNRVLDRLFQQNRSVQPNDRTLITELAYGVFRHRRLLDSHIQQVSTRPIKDIDPHIRHILRIGLYQLLFLDRIPPHAAVSETVALAPKRTRGFVNGCLRTFSRETGKPADRDDRNLSVSELGIRYSVPDWLAHLWLEELKDSSPQGVEQRLEARLRWVNERPTIAIRTNTLKTTVDALVDILQAEGLSPRRPDKEAGYPPEALLLEAPGGMSTTDSFTRGLWMVQDGASQWIGHLLSPRPGERVLDLCAAPGGKTTHLAQLMENRGELICLELHEAKAGLIAQNCKRLGIDPVSVTIGDGVQDHPSWRERPFDRVLLDAPCSGLGVLRRHPEAKWRKSKKEIEKLAALQTKLLATAARYVRPGGVLVYSVCTTTKVEGPDQVTRFLTEHPHFKSDPPVDIKTLGCQCLGADGLFSTMDRSGQDGFFAARMRRIL